MPFFLALALLQGPMAGRMDDYLRPFVQTNNLSGVILVTRRGQTLYQRGYGLADPAFSVPNTPTTRFHIASITKAFTAALVLRLEEQGKLRTTDSVARFLPDYPNGARIRLDQLLRHSSGIPNVDNFPLLENDPLRPYDAAAVVATFKDKPLDFEPGSRFRYTNSDYNLLALIIERITGRSYGDFLRTALTEPLGLTATVHEGDPAKILERLAVGTEPEGLAGVRLRPYIAWSTKTGSGSLVSSAQDLCTFASALFSGRFLQDSSLAKLNGEGVFPYGWTDRERAGHKGKGSGGRSPGFIVNLEYFPDTGTCVAILTNSYSSVGQVIAADISTIALGGTATPPPVGYARPRPGQLTPFAGRFQMPPDYYAGPAVLQIADRVDYLEARWSTGGISIIYPTGADDFVDRTNWAMVHFTRDPSGQVTGFVYNLLQDFTARKAPSP